MNRGTIFDFQAEVGLTKHLGGMKSTEELLALCAISSGQYVLDVGCGAGVTSCYIAKKHGCRVVGIDVLEGMIAWGNKRAKQMGVQDYVEFRLADAQALPFEDDLFDVVITESVTVFPEDQEGAVREYARVTKPGGRVGLNETTWLKPSPPPDMVAWASQDLAANAKPHTADGWVRLLESAGLKGIVVQTHSLELRGEFRQIIRQYGWGEMLRVWGRTLGLYRRDPAYRDFLKGIRETGVTPEGALEYVGYGLYVGRK